MYDFIKTFINKFYNTISINKQKESTEIDIYNGYKMKEYETTQKQLARLNYNIFITNYIRDQFEGDNIYNAQQILHSIKKYFISDADYMAELYPHSKYNPCFDRHYYYYYIESFNQLFQNNNDNIYIDNNPNKCISVDYFDMNDVETFNILHDKIMKMSKTPPPSDKLKKLYDVQIKRFVDATNKFEKIYNSRD